jgi:hypothetical protein
MKLSRVPFFLLLTFVFWATFPDGFNAQQRQSPFDAKLFSIADFNQPIPPNFRYTFAADTFHKVLNENDYTVVKRPTDGGINEIIPAKFQVKYQKWKNELLSTEFGRAQWENYSSNKQFILTITFGDKEGQGAGTGNYQWDETGELVGATITLGNKLDKGLPNAVYFPVMNSLSSEEPGYKISKNLLAATKFAHEFGHVNQTARMNGEFFQLQNKLMPVYNEILLKNGYNINDRNLIELTEKMGGTPVEIWENREYWGETNAMLYLFDRIEKENFYCPVFNKIKRNIALYAKDYEKRFEQIEDAKKLISVCR